MNTENKEFCTQCPNHCPITDLKCPRGRRALEGGSQNTEDHEGRGNRGEHGERRECEGRGDREERGRREGREGRGDREERGCREGRGDREERGCREGRGDREEHGCREGREERGEHGCREDRRERGERGCREERGGREEHGCHEGRGGREERGGRGERNDRRGYDGHKASVGSDEDNLESLMHACGHYLHHRGRRGGGQEGILNILAEKENMSQKELQEMLQIQPGSLSEVLMKLEQKGFITREKDEDDRRKSILNLTDAGKKALKEQDPRKGEKQLFDVLDEEEQGQLKRLLKKLLDFWKE